MTPINECSREERLERALLVIESMFSGDDMEEDERFSMVYMVAHAATGRCCRGGQEDWLKLIEKCEKEAADNNIMHVDRVFEKAIKY